MKGLSLREQDYLDQAKSWSGLYGSPHTGSPETRMDQETSERMTAAGYIVWLKCEREECGWLHPHLTPKGLEALSIAKVVREFPL